MGDDLMNKMRLSVAGVCVVLNCAPAFSQGANPSATSSNYKGLQNLVDNVNAQSSTGAGASGGGKGHKWKGGGGSGWAGGAGGGSTPAGTSGGSSIGAGAGPTGAGVDAIWGGKNGKGGRDPAKMAERKAKILKRFDSNGDGVLDDAEKAKFQAFRAAKRAERQARMSGSGGAPGGPGGLGGTGAGGTGGPGDGPRKHRMMNGGGGGPDSLGMPGVRTGGPGDFPNGFPGGGSGSPGGPGSNGAPATP